MKDPHAHDSAGHAQGSAGHDPGTRGSRTFTESAQQVWLAGLGALSRAQAEGSRLFESLVREGESMENRSRNDSPRGESLRDSVENTLGQARERAAGTWDRMERSFEERVHRVLRRMEIPSRSDIEALNARLDALSQRLEQATATSAPPSSGSTGSGH
ncbi:phasin family protein [Stenotrophomonas mori]|uniref:Phasin family protein n=1 Tax=Stenotrophomonas mori TaxID=2871096 RepID=A0ABT0SF34_9GAMM|nr:phasin family protein [Stenotrophomonas mori]MCL7713927.1 phasin family protein [Stenotrophomonas mori]